MKTQDFTLERLANKATPDKKPVKHWTDEFFKHLDAWGEEFRMLTVEARARRKSPRNLLAEILEDLADARAADRAEKASKGKPLISAKDLYKECGL